MPLIRILRHFRWSPDGCRVVDYEPGVCDVPERCAEVALAEEWAEAPLPPPRVVRNDDPDGLGTMKVADLRELAGREEIDLGAAKRKSDLVDAIRAARLARESGPPAGDGDPVTGGSPRDSHGATPPADPPPEA